MEANTISPSAQQSPISSGTLTAAAPPGPLALRYVEEALRAFNARSYLRKMTALRQHFAQRSKLDKTP